MNERDRGLIQYSAAAVGISIIWRDKNEAYYWTQAGSQIASAFNFRGPPIWNPLESDADTYWLLSKLRINIVFGETDVTASRGEFKVTEGLRFSNGYDAYAAIRSAVTQVAALIGQEKDDE